MIRAVIFDMGSTLLRFTQHIGTWREFETPGMRGIYQYIAEQGHALTTHEDAFVEAMFARLGAGWEQSISGQVNFRLHDLIIASLNDHALQFDDAALAEAARRYALPLREGVAPTPGAVATLVALRAQGFRIGLISNTIWPGELHLEDLATLGLLPHIEHTIFSGDLGLWKPQPATFEHALRALDVTAPEAIFVGDSPREDIVGAQNVGMRAVWMRSGGFPLGAVQPDAIIDALPDLLPIIAEWNNTPPK